MFSKLVSEILLSLLRDIPCLEFIHSRFKSFSGFALLARQITGISLKAINSSKESLKNDWTRPFKK